MNAFTESLALEAALLGVRAELVLPGSAPTIGFGKNAVNRTGMEIPKALRSLRPRLLSRQRSNNEVTTAEEVAEAVWKSVTQVDAPMNIPAGADAQTWFREAGFSRIEKTSPQPKL